MISTLLRVLFAVLPRVLNYLASNPGAWVKALSTVNNVTALVKTGAADPAKRQEMFATAMQVAIGEAKNPTRVVNFLREAAVLYTDWKAGKTK